MYLSTLSEWLTKIASVHATEIELGLDRVKAVAKRLNLLSPNCPVIIVGGTNGKGSCVAGLEAIYRQAGYRVGAFTSPILFKHNEQVRLNDQMANDDEFCNAFEKIEAARGDISLTPFEFHTLAALLIFQNYQLDLFILEVGLGGRLDAVNILDADVAIVTSIDLDHTDWLGPTREDIAKEKAGIFRKDKPAICGDIHPPQSLINIAAQLGAPFYCQGRDFHYHEQPTTWAWSSKNQHYDRLPLTTLATQNMATVLMVVTLLQNRLPVKEEAIRQGLTQVKLLGRIQIIEGPITEIYDVSHNPAAVAFLAKRLRHLVCKGKTHAVFSMLIDKDSVESMKAAKNVIDDWYIAPLTVKRATPLPMLKEASQQAKINKAYFFSSIQEAYLAAKNKAQPGDRIVIFGSFHTVSEVLVLEAHNSTKLSF